jgi:hypothetical protein
MRLVSFFATPAAHNEIQQQVWLIDDNQFKLEFFPLLKSCLKLFTHGSWHVFLALALQSNSSIPQGLKSEFSYLPFTSIRGMH